ncbi:MAG: leucyl aminopeptidase, partial [Planctomycetes bacterium]|nr:leucyl aminopeptidase [Planctomycetota bacterium]
MKISIQSSTQGRSRPELLIGFAHDGAAPDLGKDLVDAVKVAKATGDLATDLRKTSLFHPSGRAAPKRIGFVGMGDRKVCDTERLRRGAAVAQQHAEGCGVGAFVLKVGAGDHQGVDAAAAGQAIAEGLVLGAYRYEPPRKDKAKPRKAQRAAVEYTGPKAAAFRQGFALGKITAESTVFARDIENRPGNIVTPTYFSKESRKLAGPNLRVKILDEKEMERLGMGAFLGVSRGSAEPAKLCILDYNPRGAKQTVCIVGKGLTFDTGGISIKPSAKMDEMRYDMCGGGAVIGLFHAIAHGGLKGAAGKTRVVGLIAAAENMPDGKAQKPGDVVTAMDGTTIEVLNTDAEGRLVLADALAYARKTYKPGKMVDLATLTGAVVVALGHEMAGIMGTDDSLRDELVAAGKAADEPLWPLPLWDCHREHTKSKFADVANINGAGQGAGSTNGGAFLSYFVGDTPWCHIDIAGA